MTDVSNGDQKPPARTLALFRSYIDRHAEDSIVEIARVFAINGDERHVAKVYPALDFRALHIVGQCVGLFQRGLRKLVRHAEFSYCDFNFHARVVNFTQDFNHSAQRLGMPCGLLQNLYRHDLAVFRPIGFLRGNKNVVFDPLVFGDNNADAPFAQEATDEFIGATLQDFHNEAFQLAAVFTFYFGQHAVAVQHLKHFALRQEKIRAAIVPQQKTEAVTMTLHLAGDELKFGIYLHLALTVDEDLAVALHRA